MQEPSWLMRQVLYHFGSGDAVFLGLALLLLGGQAVVWKWERQRSNLLILSGIIWLAISGWPSLVLQTLVLLTAVTTLILPAGRCPGIAHRSFPRLSVLTLMAVLSVLVEYTTLQTPSVSVPAGSAIAIIGDSVTAGLNAGDDTWPRQLARSCPLTIRDASQQGATLRSARKQLQLLGKSGEFLILEIGGNDLLEGLPVADFATQLEILLQDAAHTGRQLIMVELPLPPFANRYGYHQRRLVRRYRIPLIPKRDFMQVLTSAGSTVDGVHLSDLGQSRLASLMQTVIRTSPDPDAPGQYDRLDELPLSHPRQLQEESEEH